MVTAVCMQGSESATSLAARLDDFAARRVRFPDARRALEARLFGSAEPTTAALVAGRYRIGRVLGQGAFGTVCIAHDRDLDRSVALKVLHGGRFDDETLGQHDVLAAEARALARVSHPHVVAVFDVGVCEGRTYLAMEYVAGSNLRRFLTERHPPAQRLALLVQAGRGLAAAHDAGIVHRDFKPENVLVGRDGRVRVGDFGLARPVGGVATREDARVEAESRHVSRLAGTPLYMAPELLDGSPADRRSDQYAFFVAVHEAAYGVRPHEAASVAALRIRARRGPARPPAAAGVPAQLFSVIARGLDPDPDRRYPDMRSAVAALVAALAPMRRSRWWLAALALALALAGWIASAPAAGASDGAERCADEAAALAGVWNADRRREVWRATISSGRPQAITGWPRVEERIDRFVATWTAEHAATCGSPGANAEVLGCLAHRRSDLDAVLSTLEARGAKSCATEVLRLLGSPTRCRHAGANAIEVDDFVAIVERAAEVGDLVCGFAGDEGTVAQARALAAIAEPHPAAASAAWSLLAGALDQVHRRELSLDADEQAFARADPYDTANRVAAANLLAQTLAETDIESAQRWANEAESLAERSGELDDRCMAAYARARVDVEKGDYQRAEVSALAALDTCGENSLEAGDLYGMLGTLTTQQQRHAEGRRWTELRRDLALRAWGYEHPRFAVVEIELGMVRPGVDVSAARRSLQHALAVLERALGPDHPETRWARSRLGLLELRAGDLEQARAILESTWEAESRRPAGDDARRRMYYLNGMADLYAALRDPERELEMHRRSVDHGSEYLGDHPLLGGALSNTANALRRAGRRDEALAMFDESIAVIERLLGPGAPLLAYPLAGRAHTLSDLRQNEAALQGFERALAIVQAGGDEIGAAVIAAHVAARLPPEERSRARALAEAALPVLRGHEPHYTSTVVGLERLLAAGRVAP